MILFCEDYCINKKILFIEFLYLSIECNEIKSANLFSIELIIMLLNIFLFTYIDGI